jgi:uncharacterized protein (DUF433 family)
LNSPDACCPERTFAPGLATGTAGKGSNIRVIQIAIDKYARGWSAEEIQAQHSHVSLAQGHAALSSYYDHQPQMDAGIERLIREDEALRTQASPSKAEQRLRQRGLLKWANLPAG